MISHRRVRSASSASHKPSKLSNSISVLTPTAEEPKAPSRSPSSNQQTGFFSSVFSAAQNAASTLSSSLNPQAKARTVAQPEPAASDESQSKSTAEGSKENEWSTGEKKPSAIDTLGSGDLDFSHLDIDAPSGGSVSTPDGVAVTKPDRVTEKRAAYKKDEEAARLEDQHAARAVSMAYEKNLLNNRQRIQQRRAWSCNQPAPFPARMVIRPLRVVAYSVKPATRPYRSGSRA
ncbi:hypothetical protein V6Z98_010116, partial [Aspergillus fumigatus]